MSIIQYGLHLLTMRQNRKISRLVIYRIVVVYCRGDSQKNKISPKINTPYTPLFIIYEIIVIFIFKHFISTVQTAPLRK